MCIYIVVSRSLSDSYDFTLAATTTTTRGSAPASASAPNVLMAKIQLAKKTVAHAHAKCQLWTGQAGGRTGGLTADQPAAKRPSGHRLTGPERETETEREARGVGRGRRCGLTVLCFV